MKYGDPSLICPMEMFCYSNNNTLYLRDYNKVLQYCNSHLKFNY